MRSKLTSEVVKLSLASPENAWRVVWFGKARMCQPTRTFHASKQHLYSIFDLRLIGRINSAAWTVDVGDVSCFFGMQDDVMR